jgi:cytochrome P450
MFSRKQQEPLFLTYVNQLTSVLRRSVEADAEAKFDMVKMYNFTTFDVMGDLTFGEPLGLLENSEFTPWVSSIFDGMIFGAYLHSIRYFPAVEKLLLKCIPESLNEKRKDHDRHSSDRVDRRLKQTSSKPDIWNLILKRDEASGLSLGEMHSNASLFMIAGTETTATLLSGVTFYLLKNPDKLKVLTDEIRGACKSDEDLTLETLAGLKYLHACLEEGLRMYPPVPSGLSRIVPPGGLDICGQYVPPKVSKPKRLHLMPKLTADNRRASTRRTLPCIVIQKTSALQTSSSRNVGYLPSTILTLKALCSLFP